MFIKFYYIIYKYSFNLDVSLAQNEAKKLLVDLQSSRTVLDQIRFVCSACHNVQDHNTDYKVLNSIIKLIVNLIRRYYFSDSI